MRFQVVTSHRLEELFAALADRLQREPLPPLAVETIVVPGQGMARWLEQQLAERFSIAASHALPFLGTFVQQLADPGGRADPFAPEVLCWRLWRLLDEHARTQPGAPLAAPVDYCRDDADGRRRFQFCRRLAACFDAYQLYRQDLLADFAAGRDHARLSPHAPWQAALWRVLLADSGTPLPTAPRPRRGAVDRLTPPLFPELAAAPSRTAPPAAHRLAHLAARLEDSDWRRQHLPERLSVFGAVTMPPAFVDLLARLARHLPVTLYVPAPTPHYTGDLRRDRQSPGDHALLAALGGESREFAELLLDHQEGDATRAPLEHIALDELLPEREPPHLLACLQQDLVCAHDRGAPGATRFALRSGDRSLQVHDCHSPRRELEVVRDLLLSAFAADPTLEPADVLVLVPDIERYAPSAHAVFGPLAGQIPVQIADQRPAAELPLCRAAAQLLALARSRLPVSEVLQLLEVEAVQRRFGLCANDLPLVRRLCAAAGIRWGRDGADRQRRHGLPPFDDNSWRFGLERLVLGTLTGPCDDLVADRLPVGGLTAAHHGVVARLHAFAAELFAVLDTLTGPMPLAAWADRLDAALARLCQRGGADDDEALELLQRATVALRAVAAQARHQAPVSATVAAAWLEGQLLQSRGVRAFLGGSVTIAALQPMRAVPARWLFVCGLDDASFPRRDQPPGFDLIAAARRRGDRDRRLDDRQLFLDLLLAARDCLHLTFVGRSAKDNRPCAPSAVLDELLDHLDRTAVVAGGGVPSEVVRLRHPLQPWNPKTAADPRFAPFGDEVATVGHAPEPPFCAAPLPRQNRIDRVVDVRDLLDFWWHPCRAFLRGTLGVALRREEAYERDDEPFQLDALQRYQIIDAELQRRLRGDPPLADAEATARRSGLLPHGFQGIVAHRELAAGQEDLWAIAAPIGPTRSRPVALQVGPWSISGDLPGVGAAHLLVVGAATIKPRHQLRAWLLHLLVTAARAAARQDVVQAWPKHTVLVGGDGAWQFTALEPNDAAGWLERLVELRDDGLQRPLPVFLHASAVIGAGLLKGKPEIQVLQNARRAYQVADAEHSFRHDLGDADQRLCMRGQDPFAGGASSEGFRLAAEIWRPLLSHLRRWPD